MTSLDYLATIIEFEDFLNDRGISPGSVYTYINTVKRFLYDAIMDKKRLNRIDVYNEYIFAHAIKKRSVYAYDALKLFIRFYYAKDYKTGSALLRNLLKPKMHDPKKIIHYLDDYTRGQVIKLMKSYKHRLIAKIQNTTGVRAGDVLKLKRGCINYEAYQDKIIVMRIDFEGKGDKHFIKWIFDEALQYEIDAFLKSNLLDDEYIFLERDKNRKSMALSPPSVIETKKNYINYLNDLKNALFFYGIEYKEWATHDFRRSFARKVWNYTKDPVVLKEMLNHAQFDTTLRYLRGTGLQTKEVYYALDQLRTK